LLYDPQTSGGLLMAVAADQADPLVRELHDGGIRHAAIIGQAKADERAGVRVV
jgi:selenide,water dikinase